MPRDDSGGGSIPGSVRVCVRVRPLLPSEKMRGEKSLVQCKDPKNVSVLLPSPGSAAGISQGNAPASSHSGGGGGRQLTTTLSRSFAFDLACHEGFGQADVFSHSGASELVDKALTGVKATIMAYGATSSGKTYTMSGLDQSSYGTDAAGGLGANASMQASSGDASAHEGLILQATRYLYSRMAAMGGGFSVIASYCEVYNEQVFDLLQVSPPPASSHQSLKGLGVRHHAALDEFFVPGLLEVRCESLSDVNAVLEEGNQNRRRASHELNADSSRSHSLLMLHVSGPAKGGGTAKGKLVFVDLAGSERLKRSKNYDHAEETGAINKSLFTLAKVISLLADHADASKEALARNNNSATLTAAPQGHVPYRDSVLTKLLSDALGGNALALFIACVSPSDARGEETLATLHYAMRARSIRNRPKVTVEGGHARGGGAFNELEAAAAQELELLKLEVARLQPFEAEALELRAQLQLLTSNASEALASTTVDPLAGGRPRRLNDEHVSKDGSGLLGRPPPGAAGRDLRDAHEKLKLRDRDTSRLETAVAVAQRGEAAAKKEASALRNMVQQLQAVVVGEGDHGGGGGGATGAGSAHSPGGSVPSSSSLALVASQRESEKLRAAALKLRVENAALTEKLGGLESAHEALEERAFLAERELAEAQQHPHSCGSYPPISSRHATAAAAETGRTVLLGSSPVKSSDGLVVGSSGGVLPPSPAAAYRATGRGPSQRVMNTRAGHAKYGASP